jgi:hypothetical protein
MVLSPLAAELGKAITVMSTVISLWHLVLISSAAAVFILSGKWTMILMLEAFEIRWEWRPWSRQLL